MRSFLTSAEAAVYGRFTGYPRAGWTPGKSTSALDGNDSLTVDADGRLHLGKDVHGHYSFRLPDLGDAWRPLRDPDQRDPDEQN